MSSLNSQIQVADELLTQVPNASQDQVPSNSYSTSNPDPVLTQPPSEVRTTAESVAESLPSTGRTYSGAGAIKWFTIWEETLSSRGDLRKITARLTAGIVTDRKPVFTLTFKSFPPSQMKWTTVRLSLNHKEATWIKNHPTVLDSRSPKTLLITDRDGEVTRKLEVEMMTRKGVECVILKQEKESTGSSSFILPREKAGNFLMLIAKSLNDFDDYLFDML